MRSFRRGPGLIPTLAVAVALALTLSATKWQFDRAAYKRALEAEYQARQAAPAVRIADGAEDAATLRYRKVEATGEFLAEHAIYLDNRVRDGVAGFEIVMPLKLTQGARSVLVNRGWMRQAARRTDLPEVETASGVVTVVGTAVVPGEAVYELSEATVEGRIWQNLVLSRYRDATSLQVADYVILQENDTGDGLLRRWAAPGFGIETHVTYAVQWLLFASLVVFFYVYYGFIRKKTRDPAGTSQ